MITKTERACDQPIGVWKLNGVFPSCPWFRLRKSLSYIRSAAHGCRRLILPALDAASNTWKHFDAAIMRRVIEWCFFGTTDVCADVSGLERWLWHMGVGN